MCMSSQEIANSSSTLTVMTHFVSTRNNYRFTAREARKILTIVQAHRSRLCDAWKEIHDVL